MKRGIWMFLALGALLPSLAFNAWHLTQRSSTSCPSCACSSGKLDPAELGLEPEQMKAIRESCEACTTDCCSSQEQAGATTKKLLAELRKDSVDEEAVRELARQLGDIRQRTVMQVAEHLLKIRSKLRPEQLARIANCCGDIK